MERIETHEEEHIVYEFFLWSVLVKGAISLAEVISGIALFFIPPAAIVSLGIVILNYVPVISLQQALMEEIARYTEGAVVFVALYLLSRGLIKAGLIFALLANKLWAYPSSLLVLGLFVLYQTYQILTDHSLLIIGITLFDLIVMYFIYREWRIVARHQGARPV
jgi:uncharacterized membrane protein